MIKLFLNTRSAETSYPFREQKRRDAHLQSRNLPDDEIRDLPCIPDIDKAVAVEVPVRHLGRNPVDDHVRDERGISGIHLPVVVEVPLRVDDDVFFLHGRVRATGVRGGERDGVVASFNVRVYRVPEDGCGAVPKVPEPSGGGTNRKIVEYEG